MQTKANKKYQLIRSRLIEKGTNISRWAQERGYPKTTVYLAARGERSGIEATKIRKELENSINE